jgi:hypothetical protein
MNESPQSTSATPSAGHLPASPNRGVSPTPPPAGGSLFAEILGDKLQRLAQAIERLQREVASQRKTLDELVARMDASEGGWAHARTINSQSTVEAPFLDAPDLVDQPSQPPTDILPRGLSLR